MPRLQDTAYPRLKSVPTTHDLNTSFTPTSDELLLARRAAKGPVAQLGFLVLLKLFQRLGRPVPVGDAPRPLVEHVAHAAGLRGVYRSHRATLFGLLDAIPLRSTTQDTSVEEALRFLRKNAGRTGEWLPMTRIERVDGEAHQKIPQLDLSWVPDGWWRLLTDEARRDAFPERVRRRHFEACVFSQLMLELKAGDLCIIGSDAFADYREQLVSWETYHERVADYGVTAGVPVDGQAFIEHVRDWLDGVAKATDDAFPDNDLVRIENGEPRVRAWCRYTGAQPSGFSRGRPLSRGIESPWLMNSSDFSPRGRSRWATSSTTPIGVTPLAN